MVMDGENEIIAKDKREFSVIDLDESSSLLANNILSSIAPKPSTHCSIYRVPDNLKEGYEDKYEPNIVSIGPYHCDKQNLKITEKHKLWYLCDFISRSTPPQISLNDMVKAVKNLEEKVRACYAEEIHLSSNDFVKMMVIDECFILELIYRSFEARAPLEEDLINNAPWLIETVVQDLVLLENQLPFIILVCLYQLNKHPNMSLNGMVFNFFRMEGPSILPDMVEGSHILDFLRNCIIPFEFNPKVYPTSFVNYDDFPCAKVLHEMGVKFKLSYDTLSFLDVRFEEGYLLFNCFHKGIMYSLFPNWIALEQCHCHFKGYITYYAILLRQLLISKDDVKFLRKTGTFEGNEDEDEKIVTEISRLCQRLKPIEFHYMGLLGEVKQYTQTGWNRQRANLRNWNAILKRDYFGTPWAVISFIAVVVLLVLTTIQTIYTVSSYSPKKG